MLKHFSKPTFRVVSLALCTLFLARLMLGPLCGICAMAIPDSSCYSPQVALSAALVVWGGALAAFAAREGGEGRAGHRSMPLAGALGGALLVPGGVWYFLEIAWSVTCGMWPFGAF